METDLVMVFVMSDYEVESLFDGLRWMASESRHTTYGDLQYNSMQYLQ